MILFRPSPPNRLHMVRPPNLRRFPRFRCERQVRLVLGRGTIVVGHAHDISQCGLAANIDQMVETGEHVTLELEQLNPAAQLESESAFQLDAVVRRRHGVLHGLEFLNLSLAQIALVRQLCLPPS